MSQHQWEVTLRVESKYLVDASTEKEAQEKGLLALRAGEAPDEVVSVEVDDAVELCAGSPDCPA
jgi:alanyl-tRNA synthetase